MGLAAGRTLDEGYADPLRCQRRHVRIGKLCNEALKGGLGRCLLFELPERLPKIVERLVVVFRAGVILQNRLEPRDGSTIRLTVKVKFADVQLPLNQLPIALC